MGHAGAIIAGGTGTAAEKMAAFEAAGIPVARIPSEIPGLVSAAMDRRRSRAGAKRAAGRGKANSSAPARRGASSRGNGSATRESARSAGRAAARGRTARRP
jgi:hypothetical protein